MQQQQGRNGISKSRVRRIGVLIVAASLAAVLCLVRLIWLQAPSFYAMSNAELAVKAVRQRQEGLILDTGRGRIVDRTGRSIIGHEVYVLAAFPEAPDRRGTPSQLRLLAEAVQADPDVLTAWLNELKAPAIWRDRGLGGRPTVLDRSVSGQVARSAVRGVYVLPYVLRSPVSPSAVHTMGFLSQHPERIAELYASELARGRLKLNDPVGGSGLERSLDRLLRGIGPVTVHRARVSPQDEKAGSRGEELRWTKPENPYYPLTVVTTLDLKLQRKLEAYAEKSGLKRGAIVVLDARNADIVAMISRPTYDPCDIAGLAATTNYALKASIPGSVFKIVTEAAALEAGKLRRGETFHCDGEHERYGLSCWKKGGHGTINMEQAFAQSCNIVFAQLAERLTPAELALTADRLGLGRQIGWSGLTPVIGEAIRPLGEEESGRIFMDSHGSHTAVIDGGVMAQSGIGQRDTAITPLQAANLMVTLLKGGKVQAPRIVQEIRYANGQLMTALPPQYAPSRYGAVSSRTAAAIVRSMESVVRMGTSSSLQQAKWTLAGKSGTAQALRNGRPVNHQWFAGFGPAEQPRYAAAVLALDRQPGSPHQATALFRGLMDIIASHEKSLDSVR